MKSACSITLSSSLGWTTIYINILCLLIYITLSSSLLLDDDLYQYTLPFNIYYFAVQPIAGRRFVSIYFAF